MKNIENTLTSEYREAVSALKFPDKRKLYTLYTTPKHTPVLRKVAVLYAAVTAAIILILALTGAAAYTLYDAVFARTKDIDITDEKREDMVENLEEWGVTPEEFASGQYDIGVNKNGDTYGHAFDGVDLISVGGYDKTGDVTGYVYRDDFEFINMGVEENAKTPEDIIKNQNDREEGRVRNWIYVYASDGYTVIGKYIQEYNYSNSMIYDYDKYSDEEIEQILWERFQKRQDWLGDFEYGFNTNEELKNPEYDKFIIYGSDYRQYIHMAQNRSNEIKRRLNENTSTN